MIKLKRDIYEIIALLLSIRLMFMSVEGWLIHKSLKSDYFNRTGVFESFTLGEDAKPILIAGSYRISFMFGVLVLLFFILQGFNFKYRGHKLIKVLSLILFFLGVGIMIYDQVTYSHFLTEVITHEI
ncbi:MAG: hypothetical protein HRT68_11510 [Flavobacteriaceae bacterium]|nr:hypothetical protein [Flavobacteriaceae bacterium]